MININKINKDLSNVKDILDKIKKKLKEAKKDISLEGKNIAVANTQQPSLVAYYDEIKVELKHLLDYADMLVRKQRGKIFRDILDTFPKALNDRAMDRLIDTDEEYISMYRTFLDVKEYYDKMSSVVNSLSQRSYTLTNLVKIYDNELQDITLYNEE